MVYTHVVPNAFWLLFLLIWCVLQTFRRILLSNLQDEFENRAKNVESELLSKCLTNKKNSVVFSGLLELIPCWPCTFPLVYEKQDSPLTTEEEEQRTIAKIKMLGNIKFIGELGKLNLIHESILHKCIKTVRLEQFSPPCHFSIMAIKHQWLNFKDQFKLYSR